MTISELYKKWAGTDAATIQKLPGAGSNRVYYRLTDAEGHSVIGVEGKLAEENGAFIALSKHFVSRGINVPQVLCVSPDSMTYIQQDLGGRSLYDALKDGRASGYTEHHKQLLKRVMAELPRIQYEGAKGLDWNICSPIKQMDKRSVMFDLNYFKYYYLKTSGLEFDEMQLQLDFEHFTNDLVDDSVHTFQYRDFQARNIMLDDNDEPWFIDFQGGRRGNTIYDLVSFLWQASARYPDELKQELIAEYLNHCPSVPSDFEETLKRMVLFRTMQVLGAYGFRGNIEKKPHFIESIPPALDNLKAILADDAALPYPHLNKLLHQLVALPRLTVTVKSFSYKRGIPEDISGNGGGYVFDCRSTHNPGRYEPYKRLTGLDPEVIRFLEDDGEITTFLNHVYALADAHVARYMERGFTHLMICFGCTGGQHRSVYCAQHVAEHLNNKFGVRIELEHREQKLKSRLEAKIVR